MATATTTTASTTKAPKQPIVQSGKTIKMGPYEATVYLSSVWTSVAVGVFIDIPLTGSATSRAALGSYIIYAFEKFAAKYYHTPEFGVFNPRMGKDGMRDLEVCCGICPDGAPSSVRVQFEAKATKLGQVIANVLAKVCFHPPKSDLADARLACFRKNEAALMWAGHTFAGIIKSGKMKMVLVGGKKNSVKESVAEKFATAFGKKLKDPEIKSSLTADKVTDITLYPEFSLYPTSIPKDRSSFLPLAQAYGGQGTLWVHNGTIGTTSTPEMKHRIGRTLKSAVGNESKVHATLNWYANFRDKLGDHRYVVAAVASGLPIYLAEELATLKVNDMEKTAKAVSESVLEALSK